MIEFRAHDSEIFKLFTHYAWVAGLRTGHSELLPESTMVRCGQSSFLCSFTLSLPPYVSCLLSPFCFFSLFPFSSIRYEVPNMCLVRGLIPSLLCPVVLESPHFSVFLCLYPVPNTPSSEKEASPSEASVT